MYYIIIIVNVTIFNTTTTSMKLCVFLILATATSVIADGHADICSSQFNWWYGVSNNQGPAGYPDETAEEKLHRLVKKALPDGTPIPSMCEMQKNANGYYHHWEEILREINNMPPDAPAPGFGFPFQSRTGKSYNGLTPTCVPEDSIAGRFITFDDVQNNAGILEFEIFHQPLLSLAGNNQETD